jgi:hypothetical protein
MITNKESTTHGAGYPIHFCNACQQYVNEEGKCRCTTVGKPYNPNMTLPPDISLPSIADEYLPAMVEINNEDTINICDKVNIILALPTKETKAVMVTGTVLDMPSSPGGCWHIRSENGKLVYVDTFFSMTLLEKFVSETCDEVDTD